MGSQERWHGLTGTERAKNLRGGTRNNDCSCPVFNKACTLADQYSSDMGLKMDAALQQREGAIDLRIRAPATDGCFDNWREAFGRTFLRLDVEPSGTVFSTDISLRALPGLGLGSITTSACSLTRTQDLLTDGQDDIGLVALLRGRGRARDRKGRDVDLRPGEAVFLRNGTEGAVDYTDDTQHLCFTIPQQALAPFISDLDAACMRAINAESGPLALLLRYAQIVVADDGVTREAGAAIARHVHDLAAMVMTGSPELAMALVDRGGRAAARLAAIKADIVSRLSDSTLSVTTVAARFAITPRYVARLFEQDGTTFTAFVLEQRLSRARSLLMDPNKSGQSISTLALASGFGDISYFNKRFRQRYSATPSDIREAARPEDG
ncbi:AraC family transcriptional regulator [Stappia sp. WLB 29]|uniref:AraC family transcriptional regulator n=1 Tax=Stappia sp. WLB 29 TaxID=2925220 RepID=UPI0020C08AA5|nr:AraC family transcriptional regulator [Stappia sp. WLB 29]